jgi:serine/threonine protein kinase
MLTGFPPYDQANRTDQRFELIVTGRLMEQLKTWDIFLSDEAGECSQWSSVRVASDIAAVARLSASLLRIAGDLMQKMLQLHPKNRLTLDEVFKHPWVTNEEVEMPVPQEAALSFS